MPECPNREYCPAHEHNTQTLTELSTERRLVKWVGGWAAVVLISFCVWQYEQLDAMKKIANNIDKTVTTFVETTAEYRKRVDDRLNTMLNRQQDHEERLRDLERQ